MRKLGTIVFAAVSLPATEISSLLDKASIQLCYYFLPSLSVKGAGFCGLNEIFSS